MGLARAKAAEAVGAARGSPDGLGFCGCCARRGWGPRPPGPGPVLLTTPWGLAPPGSAWSPWHWLREVPGAASVQDSECVLAVVAGAASPVLTPGSGQPGPGAGGRGGDEAGLLVLSREGRGRRPKGEGGARPRRPLVL